MTRDEMNGGLLLLAGITAALYAQVIVSLVWSTP